MGKGTGNKDTVETVRALDIATGTIYSFPVTYRFGAFPKHMFAPPFFTDAKAFALSRQLSDASVGQTVFIEWALDRFYVKDDQTGEFVLGSTVWRKSKMLGPDEGDEGCKSNTQES